jgi:hypothetical protein
MMMCSGYSEADRGRLEQVLTVLEGKVLEGVAVDCPGGDTVLRFAGRLVLRLMSIEADCEHWFWYMPEGVLVFGPGTEWGFENVECRIEN